MAKKKQPEIEIPETIVPATLDEMMGERFNIYAKDVIQDRAIPDARDGMKPVQRRIIFAMWKTGNTIEKPTKKCAHIVGEVMGKYHPHGDSSIYDALVRMSQTWVERLPLVDFQGNNGSMDGDGPAAYRYTEARLAAVSQELIRDIDKETVDMALTFDDTEFEPSVLPARFPNLLVNGASGIAVGMATYIPPHNLGEVINAVIHRIQYPNCPLETLMSYVPGPDFPTGGIIYRGEGLREVYATGKGRIVVASRVHMEKDEKGRDQIVVTEIPYGVNKSQLVFQIDKLRHDKVIAGIEEVRDETDKEGLRIAIDVKEGFKPESILTYLYNKTDLRTSISPNLVAIVDGRPVTLNLLSYCDTYIAHQIDVVTRRCRFDLDKDLARLEIVEGLIKASSLIHEVVRVIEHSADKADSKKNIIAEFGFTENQAEAIVMMPLYKLSHFDVAVIEDEKKRLDAEIADLKETLQNPEKRNALLIADLRAIAKKYGSPRRTSIEDEDASSKTVDARDLIAKETVMVVLTRDAYLKRSSLNSYRSSSGPQGALPGLKEGDCPIYIGSLDTTDYLLAFTNKGNFLTIPVHMLPAKKWNEEGNHVNTAVNIPAEEKIVSAFGVRLFRDDLYVVLISKRGSIKRTKLSAFAPNRVARAYRAMKLLGDDEVCAALPTSGNHNLLVMAESGLATFYNENEVPLSLTASSGVKGGAFKGSPIGAILGFLPEEKGKIALLTNRANLRIFGLSNIQLTPRLAKATALFSCFKNEPHALIGAFKLEGKEPPFSFLAQSDKGEAVEIPVADAYLTPMEKYAKGGVKKLQGSLLCRLYGVDGLLLDEKTPSFPLPVKEEPTAPEASPVKEEEPKEGKYEQTTLFDLPEE